MSVGFVGLFVGGAILVAQSAQPPKPLSNAGAQVQIVNLVTSNGCPLRAPTTACDGTNTMKA